MVEVNCQRENPKRKISFLETSRRLNLEMRTDEFFLSDGNISLTKKLDFFIDFFFFEWR